jgi:hypothetical protein
MTTKFYNDNMIDSRDLINRLDELQDAYDQIQEEADRLDLVLRDAKTCLEDVNDFPEERLQLEDDLQEAQEEYDAYDLKKLQADFEDLEELEELKRVDAECDGGDWRYGTTLVSRYGWEEYCDDMIQECENLPKDLPYFVKIVIDYDAMEQDYSSVMLDGYEYLYRN